METSKVGSNYEALTTQVGGIHYKSMKYQPVVLFAITHCTAFQANIWKYISRYKAKNGKEDIEKCMHYAELAREFDCKGHLGAEEINAARYFCMVNELPEKVRHIVMLASFDEYGYVIKICEQILQEEYAVK